MVSLDKLMVDLETLVPSKSAQSWDRVGLQVGNPEQKIENVLIALDLHESVLEEAKDLNVQMILTHHPLIFSSLQAITTSNWVGNMIYKLISENVALYTMHTNLDQVAGGLNDQLCQELGLTHIEDLDVDKKNRNGIGMFGELSVSLSFSEFLDKVKSIFSLGKLSFTGDLASMIGRVGVCTGAGGGLLPAAIAKGCDVYLTGDLSYHKFQDAERNGLCLVDVGHYICERRFLPGVTELLNSIISEVNFICSEVSFNPEQQY